MCFGSMGDEAGWGWGGGGGGGRGGRGGLACLEWKHHSYYYIHCLLHRQQNRQKCHAILSLQYLYSKTRLSGYLSVNNII